MTNWDTSIWVVQCPLITYYFGADFKAEILWILHLCVTHQSLRANNNINKLFTSMFSVSEIAKNFKCGRHKAHYVINFGLAPYFLSELSNHLIQYGIKFEEFIISLILLNFLFQKCVSFSILASIFQRKIWKMEY